jgi:NAD(P)H-hydrate epimerase
MPGAAILVVRAAHRAGAGRVTLACLDREMLSVVPAASPETVLLDLSNEGVSAGEGDVPGIPTSPAFHSRVVGPGLGDTERTRALLARTLAAPGPQVIDADALNVLGDEPERLAQASGPTVVTPHAGEAARLLGRDVPRDREGRIAAARELARRTGGLCVLKGAGSVVTDGDRVHVNATGNPGMATAGAGDVLCGILGAYLAGTEAHPDAAGSGFDAFAATVAAVHVHGLAGDLAAEALGRRAVVAGDLVELLPEAQLALEEGAGGR